MCALLPFQNVLVDCNLKAKISDFGLAAKYKATAGSPRWMAPELLRGESNSPASDVYAFGVLLSELLTRQLPYAGMDFSQVLERLSQSDGADAVRPALPTKLPPGVGELVQSCWAGEPSVRPTMSEVAQQVSGMHIQNLSISLFARRADQKNQARLLTDVFPSDVADTLKRGEKVQPQMREFISLFRCSVANYDALARDLPPAKVSDMVDRLFSALDRLADKHGLFKVEMRAETYVCAANLVRRQPNHTEMIARFAMDAIRAASSTLIDQSNPALGCLELNCGMCVG